MSNADNKSASSEQFFQPKEAAAETTQASEISRQNTGNKESQDILKQVELKTAGDTSKVASDGNVLTVPTLDFTTKDSTERKAEKPESSAESALSSSELVIREAEAIRKATGNDNLLFRHADSKRILDLLENKTEKERQSLDVYYQARFGKSLTEEMSYLSGADKARFDAALHRKDGDLSSQAADTIHINLVEREQLFFGRNDTLNERAIRDTLSKENSEQIASINKEYESKHGVSLREALLNNPHLSSGTKEMAEIYLKGVDKRTDADSKRLTDIALNTSDAQMFNEAMSVSSPKARQDFMANQGQETLKQVFGTGKDFRHALDYAQTGSLSALNQIKENTGAVADNTQGIEHALKSMQDKERSDYLIGKKLSGEEVALSKQDQNRLDAMTGDEKLLSKSHYIDLDEALRSAGNEAERTRWEALITSKDNLAATLDKHNGIVRNDSVAVVVKSVEDMSRDEWQSARDNPNTRQDMLKALKLLGKDDTETAQIMSVYDRKVNAADYKDADNGKRSIFDKLDDNTHWYRNDRAAIVQAIEGMTAEEKTEYREDSKYKQELDNRIEKSIKDGPGLEAARTLLSDITQGKESKIDIITKLQTHASDLLPDREQAIREVRDEFNKNPEMLERIRYPQNDNDRQLSDSFQQLSREVFGNGKYKSFVNELMASGSISAKKMISLDKGLLDSDEEKTIEDIAALSIAERQKLANDSAYQSPVFSHLDQDESKIASLVAVQGEYRLEDKLQFAIQASGDSSKILDSLKGVKPDQLNEVRSEFARKYGGSLDDRILEKLSGPDEVEAKRLLSNNLTAEEKSEQARDDAYSARSGMGAWAMDNVFRSATGAQTDAAINNSTKELAQAHALFMQVDQKQLADLDKSINESVENHRKAKATTADTIADVSIAAGAIGSVIVSGGTSVPLIVGVAAGSAATKVATRAAMMGDSYDFSVKQMTMDATTGAIAGATALVGPAQIAAVFKIGTQAARNAAAVVVAEESVKAIVREGGDQVVTKGMESVMHNALTSGATSIPQDGLQKIAEQVVSDKLTDGARDKAVEELTKAMHTSLSKQFELQTKNHLQNIVRQEATNMAAGASGSTASTATTEISNWDSTKSTADNLAKFAKAEVSSVLSAAGGALLMSTALKAGKSLLHPAEAAVGPKSVTGDPDAVYINSSNLPPRDTTALDFEVPSAIMRSADSAHYAAESVSYNVKIGNDVVKLDKSITLGRDNSNYVMFPQQDVSSKHMQIQLTADGPLLRDLNSTNGTYVNGRDIGRSGAQFIKPGDRISFGKNGPDFIFGKEIEPGVIPRAVEEVQQAWRFRDLLNIFKKGGDQPQLVIDGKVVPIEQPRVLLGRDSHSNITFEESIVSRRHAEIEQTSRGPILRDLNSTLGTTVNGKAVDAEGVLLKPGDRISLGGRKEFIYGQGAKSAEAVEKEQAKFYQPVKGLPDSAANPEAVRQSNRANVGGEIRERLSDGFQARVYDRHLVIKPDGTWDNFNTATLIVDRQRDKELANTIQEAHKLFDKYKSSPSTLAEELAKFSKQKMTPTNFANRDLDTVNLDFVARSQGNRILLGEFIAQAKKNEGGGICIQQALLFKVLGDEFGLDTSLIYGFYGNPTQKLERLVGNHAWNEVHIDGKARIYDPRQEKFNIPQHEMMDHNGERNFKRDFNTRVQKYRSAGVQPGDYVTLNGSRDWQVSNETSKIPGHIVLRHDAVLDVAESQILNNNPGRNLEIGQSYQVDRSGGTKDLGWIYQGRTPEGQLRLMKRGAKRLEIDQSQLANIVSR